MKFDFTKIEGIDAELAESLNANEALTGGLSEYLNTSIESHVGVAKTEFKSKMDALNAKKEAAEAVAASFKGVDPDELETLKAARDKNPELQATLDALKKTVTEREQALEQQAAKLGEMQHSHLINQAVAQYNTENKDAYGIKSDATDLIAMLAKNSIKIDENGQAKVFNERGEVLATDKGPATPIDWLKSLRETRPSLFSMPVGSGAKGSTGDNGGGKVMSRADFGKLPPAKQAEVARTHELTD